MGICQQDVIDFLTWLAVERKVSASSQNQAFNALLFLFKQVLKKDFDDIKGVIRAKRKPYIPVVLSRNEIDLILDYLDEPINWRKNTKMHQKNIFGSGFFQHQH